MCHRLGWGDCKHTHSPPPASLILHLRPLHLCWIPRCLQTLGPSFISSPLRQKLMTSAGRDVTKSWHGPPRPLAHVNGSGIKTIWPPSEAREERTLCSFSFTSGPLDQAVKIPRRKLSPAITVFPLLCGGAAVGDGTDRTAGFWWTPSLDCASSWTRIFHGWHSCKHLCVYALWGLWIRHEWLFSSQM